MHEALQGTQHPDVAPALQQVIEGLGETHAVSSPEVGFW
jgi:hypothetical protein